MWYIHHRRNNSGAFLEQYILVFYSYGNRIAFIKNIISSGKKPYLKLYPKNLTFLHITKLRKFLHCMHDQREEGYAVSSLRNRMIYSVRDISSSEFTQTFKTKKVFAEKYCWMFFSQPLEPIAHLLENRFLVWKSEMSTST